MKRIFYLLFLFSVPLLANYCIQAVTLDRFNPDRMSTRLSSVLGNFEDARVEERGSYLVLRVGDFNSYSQALSNIKSIKEYYSDAYIRKCDFDTSRVLYPDFSTSGKKRTITHTKRYVRAKPTKKPVETVKYEQPEPQNTYDSNTLWQDCQKCFAPIYLEEEEDETQTQTQVVSKKETQKVKKQKISTKKDSDFWVEAVDDKEETFDEDSEKNYDPTYYPEIDTNRY